MKRLTVVLLLVLTFVLTGCQGGDPDLIFDVLDAFDNDDINETVREGKAFRDVYGRSDAFIGDGNALMEVIEDDNEVYIMYLVAEETGAAYIEISLTIDGNNVEVSYMSIEYMDFEQYIGVEYSTSWSAESVYIRENYETIYEAINGLSVKDIQSILIELGIRELK